MPLAGIVTIIGVFLTVAALAYYLIHVILLLRRVHFNLGTIVAGLWSIAYQTEGLDGVMREVNGQMQGAANQLEGLLTRKLGQGATDDLGDLADMAQRELTG